MSLIATWNPQFAVFYDPYCWGDFEVDIHRFGRLIRGETEPEPYTITDPTVEDVRKLVRESPEGIAVDIETSPDNPNEGWTGKDPTRARLKTIGLGNSKWGLSFKYEGGTLIEQEVQKVFADEKVCKIFHNGPWFDIRVLARYGFGVLNWEDTRDLRRALSSTSKLSLRYLGQSYTDFEPWKEDDSEDAKGLVFTDDIEKLKRYNALDCVVTHRAYVALLAEVARDPRIATLYELHKKLSTIAAEMHTTGFLVDKTNMAFLAWGLEQQFIEQQETLLKLVNVPGFEGSPDHMRALLFKRHEVRHRPAGLGKKGQVLKGKPEVLPIARFGLEDPQDPKMWSSEDTISVDTGTLLRLLTNPACPADMRAIIEAYWKAASTWKARSTFVTSDAIWQAIGRDDRLRPGWNSCGTDTGRWSCSEPNIMNIKEYLRASYRASEGNLLVHADYSQLELRVMAAVAGDEELQRRLDIGDVYTEDAKDWFGLPKHYTKKEIKPSARKQAKIIHLGAQYAAGTDAIFLQGLAQDQSLKYKTAQALHAGFKKTYVQTCEYWLAEQERVRTTGYSEDRILGRRRTYPAEPPITEIANYPIQATASAIVNLAMERLHEQLKKYGHGALISQLHDAFDCDTPEAHVVEVREIMRDSMETPYMINGKSYIFPVEFKIASHWNDV